MSEMILAGIVDKVINDCTTETQFDQFVNAVNGGTAWDWLFHHGPLTHTFTLPPAPVTSLHFTDHLVQPLVQHVRVVKNWSLSNHYQGATRLSAIPAPLSPREVFQSFFINLLDTFAKQMSDVRFLTSPVAGTWTTAHEGGIGPIVVTGHPALWELTGDTSAGWLNRTDAFTALLPKLDADPNATVSTRLGRVTRQEAEGFFAPLVNGSGSCLVGVLVAELKNQHYQTRRFVAAAANMCGSRGSYAAHTRRGQGSQIHMEIFLFERLGAYLQNTTETYSFADVGILGLKTSNVVAENAMCGACQATQVTELNNRMAQRTFGICFLG